MSEKRQPWGKWYWGDWRKDARLRRCSYAARGLWADMLSLMGGECDRYGVLIMEGQALQPDDLAGLLGGSAREIEKMLSELEIKRVFNRVGDADMPQDVANLLGESITGAIVSRRMVRDAARSEEGRIHRAKRDASSEPSRSNNENDELPIRAPSRSPSTQKPEARSQKPDQESLLPDLAEEFAAWYAAYPLKKARHAAEKAYRTARKSADSVTLLAAAQRFAEQRRGQDPKFTAHPATWLNQKRWEDQEQYGPQEPPPSGDGLRQRLRIKGYRETGLWLPEWGEKPPPDDAPRSAA